MIDSAVMTFVGLGIVGAILVGSIIFNSLTPSLADGEKVLYSERCTIRYSILGLLRMGGPTPSFFSISDRHITVKLIFTNRYNISDIRSAKLGRGPFAQYVGVNLWRSIATIHIYSKNPEEVLRLIVEVRSRVDA